MHATLEVMQEDMAKLKEDQNKSASAIATLNDRMKSKDEQDKKTHDELATRLASEEKARKELAARVARDAKAHEELAERVARDEKAREELAARVAAHKMENEEALAAEEEARQEEYLNTTKQVDLIHEELERIGDVADSAQEKGKDLEGQLQTVGDVAHDAHIAAFDAKDLTDQKVSRSDFETRMASLSEKNIERYEELKQQVSSHRTPNFSPTTHPQAATILNNHSTQPSPLPACALQYPHALCNVTARLSPSFLRRTQSATPRSTRRRSCVRPASWLSTRSSSTWMSARLTSPTASRSSRPSTWTRTLRRRLSRTTCTCRSTSTHHRPPTPPPSRPRRPWSSPRVRWSTPRTPRRSAHPCRCATCRSAPTARVDLAHLYLSNPEVKFLEGVPPAA